MWGAGECVRVCTFLSSRAPCTAPALYDEALLEGGCNPPPLSIPHPLLNALFVRRVRLLPLSLSVEL